MGYARGQLPTRIGPVYWRENMGNPGPVQFETKDSARATVLVTTQDGQKFDVQMAILVLGVLDQGVKNPLDGLPIFQVASQVLMQVKRHPDG